MGELAVDPAHQRAGIGRELQRLLRERLGPECKIKLSSTHDAATYYPRIGYTRPDHFWELKPGTPLG